MALKKEITKDGITIYSVENDKKYYWTAKNKDFRGRLMHLDRRSTGLIKRVPFALGAESEQLTESEIIEAGYNPNDYVKGEVE